MFPSPFLSIAEKLVEPALLAVVPLVAAPARLPAVGALGSPVDCVLGDPPVFGEVPMLLAPDGPWARIVLGTAKAAATAHGSKFFSFIEVS
jgi:hypothetical protein